MQNQTSRSALRLLQICVCALILSLAASGCGHDSKSELKEKLNLTNALKSSSVAFVEIAKKSGIDFKHSNGAAGKKNMPETVGSGVAFLDYDNDGWQDILIINSMNWPGDKPTHSTMRLYHNEKNGTFKDVTREAGLDIEMYGMGVAVGDFDNDGYEDLFITAIGPNHLFRNTLGDKDRKGAVFQDVTLKAGVQGVPVPGTELKWKWSASAAWVDYDKDGKLDLFVTQYVKWSPEQNQYCGHNGIRGYCPPNTYEGTYCTLYHNEGGGHFKNVSDETGISKVNKGKSFGIAVGDYNRDGFPDIAVSNDTWANYLFINEGGKKFSERGVESGIGVGENGHYKAGMGIDSADYKNNGQFSLIIGNFAGEGLSLFDNDGKMLFTENSHQAGLSEPSLLFLTFGLFFFDYDLDGWQDVFTANGHVDDVVSTYNSMLSFKERPMLFRNQGDSTFKEVGKEAGLAVLAVGRGTAYGDIDNDGYLDVALVDNGGTFRLFHNQGGDKNHWIRFHLIGSKSNKDGIGATIRLKANGLSQTQYVRSGGSFLSENMRRPTFGLGKTSIVDEVEIVWPSGIADRLKPDAKNPLTVDREYSITEGVGIKN